MSAFDDEQIAGAQEEVQIREQDFGNFQVGVGGRGWAWVGVGGCGWVRCVHLKKGGDVYIECMCAYRVHVCI